MNSKPDKPIEDESPVDAMTYEQAFTELEEIVAALESEEHSLEGTLALFERGQALARRCESLLDTADLKVQQLLGKDLVDLDPGK
jgi:exodeoxyribonuclease VII small subunit